MASKRKSLCIDEKVLLIRAIETGEKISDVGKRFGFSRSTVSTIWKNKEKILQADSEGKSSKKLKKPKYEDLDQAILSWFHQQRQNDMPISGPLVKAKAENFAEELGLTSFKASEGWLGKFKQRHHINFGKISGEARSVDTNVTHDWITRMWSKFKEKYAPSDIFNANSVRKSEVQEQEDEEDETDEHEPPPSVQEALKAAKLLENYFLYHQDASISQDMKKIIKKIQQNYRINANAAFLCNYEVMQILQKLKDNTQRKHKREASLATVTYETVHYLQNTECKNQSEESIQKCLEAMKCFKLTKCEKLMMVNTPPRTELEIQLIVQESEERLSEEEVRKIIAIVNEFLPASS